MNPSERDLAAQTTTFLDRILERVPVDAGLYGYLWTLSTKRTTSWQIGAAYPDIVTAPDRPSGLYVGTTLTRAPLERHQRASRETAAASMGVYLDIDLAHPVAHPHPNLPETIEEAGEILVRTGCPPTLLVSTGFGVQAWWLFEEPIFLESEADRAAAEALSTGWVAMAKALVASEGWHLDSVGDLARILRLPGTFNSKVGGDLRTAQLLVDDGPRYDPEALRSTIESVSAKAMPDPMTTAPSKPVAESKGDFVLRPDAEVPERWTDLTQRHPRAEATFNYDRDDLVDQSPSSYDMSLAVMAAMDSWDDQDTVDLLIACRRHHGGPTKSGRPDYYARTLAKAMFFVADRGENPEEPPPGPSAAIAVVGLVPSLADAFEDEAFLAQDASGLLHVYSGGVYQPIDRRLKSWVRSRMEDWAATRSWKASLPKDLAEYLRAGAPDLLEHPGFDHLNVRNGLVNLRTGELLPHDPHHRVTQQLPVEFAPEAACPAWDRFIGQVFPEDAAHVAFEILAMAMVPDPSVQQAVMLVGPGGNGKSVYLRALTAFLGPGNVSTETLHRLESNRFAAVRLQGKLANIAADLPASELAGSATFKGITGGDTLPVEKKFQDAYDLRPFAKMIFSCNLPPKSPDASDAFYARWRVVPFTRSFRGETTEVPSLELDRRLHDPGELSGALNRAIAALVKVRSNGLSEPLSMVTAKNDFRRTTDPVSTWLEEATLETPMAVVPKALLLETYNGHAVGRGMPPMTPQAFARAIKSVRPHIRGAQRQWSGSRAEVWVGLGLRDPAPTMA